LNQFASRLVGWLPPAAGGFLGSMGLTGGVWTALRMTELIELRHAAFRCLMAEVDHVIALCEWVKQVLLRNHVPAEKITVCRQGLVQDVDGSQASRERDRRKGDRLRIAFLGRLDATKGVHVLLEALRSMPDLDVELDIYGVAQGPDGTAYLERLKTMADARIRFLAPIPARDVVSTLRDYDVLAVPSQWLETGPMVVLEAFAAGVPVIGSDLGGIAELVRHGVDGLLLEPGSVTAWAETIRGLATDSIDLTRLRANILQPRRIAEAAQEIDRLYRRFVPAHCYA
jgi:glycosyltransferase involved in cell wall biosynthesis